MAFNCLLICGGFVFLLFVLPSYSNLIAVTRTVWQFSEPGTPHRTTLPTPAEIDQIRLCLGLIILALLLVLTWLQRKQKLFTGFLHHTKSEIRHIFQAIGQSWGKLSGFEKRLVYGFFLLITVLRFYYLFRFPLHPDESVSAIAFADRGILAVTGIYHIPNNHIFYNLFAWVFSPFIEDHFWLSRVPAILISSGFLIVCFLLLLRLTAFPTAFLVSCLFGFHQNSLYYAVHGRGYYLLTFLAVLAALALVQLTRKKADFYWLVFVACSVLGFYTAVTFLYTFVGLLLFAGFAFLLQKDSSGLLKLIGASALVTVCVLLLLSPLFILSGPETLYNHKLMAKIPWPEFLVKLPFYLRYISGACLGQETIGFWIYLLLIPAFGFFYLKRKALNFLFQQISPAFFLLGSMAMVVGLAPVPVIVAQQLFPYERLLVYKSFFDLLLLGLVVATVLTLWLKNYRKVQISVIVLAVLFGLYHSYKIRTLIALDQRSCAPDTIQRALKQYGDPDKGLVSDAQ